MVAEGRAGVAEAADGLAQGLGHSGPGPFGRHAGAPVASAEPDRPGELTDQEVWERCRAVLDERVPGNIEQAVKDADTFFGIELPALAEWRFVPDQAAALRQPVLSPDRRVGRSGPEINPTVSAPGQAQSGGRTTCQ